MLPRSPDTDASLQAFRRYARLDHDSYALGSVGDSPEIATELADLVIPEIKRAIASLARDCGEGREPMPRPGDFDMILDGDEHRPRLIWRTTQVTIKPLSQVDEAFAWDEGEGDRTRDWWAAHRRDFGRQASRGGFEFDDEILTVFERFEVVWPLDICGQRSQERLPQTH